MRKYVLLLLVATMTSVVTEAQKLNYGAEVGLTVSGATVHDPGGDPHGTPLPGFQLGVFGTYDLPVPRLAVGARVLYSYEGYDANVYDTKATIHVSFLKIPVNAIYKADKWFFGLGPYAGVGLGGHYTSMDNKVTIHFGGDPNNDDLKRVDVGADLMAGYQLNKQILLRASFDFGLINYLTPGSTTDASAHTLSLGITGAYQFGGK